MRAYLRETINEVLTIEATVEKEGELGQHGGMTPPEWEEHLGPMPCSGSPNEGLLTSEYASPRSKKGPSQTRMTPLCLSCSILQNDLET